jgi:hypothetical protein
LLRAAAANDGRQARTGNRKVEPVERDAENKKADAVARPPFWRLSFIFYGFLMRWGREAIFSADASCRSSSQSSRFSKVKLGYVEKGIFAFGS